MRNLAHGRRFSKLPTQRLQQNVQRNFTKENEMLVAYGSLSRNERQAARKLAKELLGSVPAAQKTDESGSLREAVSTAFMKPENVIGALVYTDGNGNWWGDVVFKKGERRYQTGTQEGAPARSYDDALEHVKSMMAHIKAMRDDPLVQEFRDRGFDPERVELLRVRHKKFGQRWVLLKDDQIWSGAEAFVAHIEKKSLGVVDKLEQARTIIVQTAPQFATNAWFLLPAADDNDEKKDALELLYYAAAFLLSCGILNVDEDATQTNFGRTIRVMLPEPPTLH
jgi:hypothetical protein